jgi:hypothetical protein
MGGNSYMGSKLTSLEQDQRLATAYQKMNEEGRDVLDMVTGKLAEIEWGPKETGNKEGFLLEKDEKIPQDFAGLSPTNSQPG